MDTTPKSFKKIDNRDLRLVQNLTLGEADVNQLMHLRNQQVIAAENIGREENLSSVLIPTMSEDLDEQLKQAHKVVDVAGRPRRNICLTLLRYNFDKPESAYAQVPLFGRKKEDEKFRQIVIVNYTLYESNHLPDEMNSVYDETFTY